MMLKHTVVLFCVAFVLSFLYHCSSTSRIFYITEFGAVGDGLTVNTSAIQSAIDRCAEKGGGTVVVPEGTFLSGALFLKQGVSLHVGKNGVLKGTVEPADYPQVDTRWEGTEMKWISAFVNAFGMSGFSITGEGTIDGSGDEWIARYPRYPGPEQIQLMASTNYAGKPRLIAIQNCSDVKVSGLNLINQASWGLFILYSDSVLIENLDIQAEHNIPSSDGIDIDSSKDVRINECTIDVNDDCIAIKSGKDEDGRRVNRPSEDIIVENCLFQYGHGGVSMGSEMSGGIRNVLIRNCTMEADNWAPIRFKSQPSRGGVVENITYENIILNNTRKAFEFNMEWRMVPPLNPPSDPLPVVRNVRIINVSGTTGIVGDMHGLDDSPIRDVQFINCRIQAKRGFTIDNVENVDLSGLTIEVEEGEPIMKK